MKNLEEKSVEKLYNECVLKNDELTVSGPNVLFTPVKSMSIWSGGIVFFSTERLNAHKKEIIEILDSLQRIDLGNDLYNLCYDKNNKRWCTSYLIVHELIDLAIACQLINYAIIMKKRRNMTIIIRNYEKDNLNVQGVDPEPYVYIPNGCVKDDCRIDEKTLLNLNRQASNRKNASIIGTINMGLSFFEIYGRINANNPNQIDFYDKDNRHLYRQKITHSILDFFKNSKCYYNFSFKDKHGDIIDYQYNADDNTHIFNFKKKKVFSYALRIVMNDDGYGSVAIDTLDCNGKIIKKFFINDSKLNIELSTLHAKRELSFNTSFHDIISSKDNEDILSISEVVCGDPLNSHSLTINSKEVILNQQKSGISSTRLLFFVASNIVFHPRNKAFIQYILDKLDKELPGIKDFVFKNFPLYKKICDGEYQEDDLTENYVERLRNVACDIEENGKKKNMTYFD